MNIKQYLEDNSISIYKVVNSALVAYPTVYNIVNGKVDILNCALGVVKKIADALNLTRTSESDNRVILKDIDENYPKLINEGNLASVLEAAKRKKDSKSD